LLVRRSGARSDPARGGRVRLPCAIAGSANAWHNAFNRLQRCYERRENVIDAFFDLADAIITVRSLIRQAWTAYRWDARPGRRP
jgi:hypothetical protein